MFIQGATFIPDSRVVLKIRSNQLIQSLCLHNNWVVVTIYQEIIDKYFDKKGKPKGKSTLCI